MSLISPEVVNDYDMSEAKFLSHLIKALNVTGHNPATSGNYSIRSQHEPKIALVSESGIDKSLFSESNLLPVTIETGALYTDAYVGRKSSDETGLHLAVYQSTDAGCVLHSHLLEGLLFADLYPQQEVITLTGLELLKGLKGVKTHEASIKIPVFENSQDIVQLAKDAKTALKELEGQHAPIFILRGHGFYVWGANVKEAKRHLEVFEYIFKYFVERKRLAV